MSTRKAYIKTFFGGFLILFGLLTVFAGSSVFLDLFDMRAKEGNYVDFVVAANVFSGFLYLFAAYGMFRNKQWAVKTLGFVVLLLVVTFIAFAFYIKNGGVHETKTIYAMSFRTTAAIILAVLSNRLMRSSR